MSDSKRDPDIVIFDYDTMSDYITAIFQSRKRQRSTYSLRAWAIRLGLKATDSGNLSRVITGKRSLSTKLGKKIAEDLKLSGYELAYFEILSVGSGKISRESFAYLQKALQASNRTGS